MKFMKNPARLVKMLLVGGLLSATGTTSVFGFGAVFTIDNNGDAYFTSSQMCANTLATDPQSGMTTLHYTLPFTGTAGDVLLAESAGGSATDILRFDGASHVYFFSTDGLGSPAHVSTLPSSVSPSQGPFTLLSSGGNFSYRYSPMTGQPGYNSGTVYDLVVSVPEPGALAIGSLSGVLLLFRSRRENNRK